MSTGSLDSAFLLIFTGPGHKLLEIREEMIFFETRFFGVGNDDGFMVVIVGYRTNLISIHHNLITRACALYSYW